MNKIQSVSFMVSKTESSQHYPVKIGIEHQPNNPYGYSETYPYKIVLDFGDYPIILRKSKSEETLQKLLAHIIKKSKLFQGELPETNKKKRKSDIEWTKHDFEFKGGE